MTLPRPISTVRRVNAAATSPAVSMSMLIEPKSPPGETIVKSDGELMEILNAYKLTGGSSRAAAELSDRSHHTVKKAAQDRNLRHGAPIVDVAERFGGVTRQTVTT